MNEAFFWCGHEPSRAEEMAALARGTIAEIAATIDDARHQILIGFPRTPDPALQELKSALFVLQKLEETLSEWPEYWDDQYED